MAGRRGGSKPYGFPDGSIMMMGPSRSEMLGDAGQQSSAVRMVVHENGILAGLLSVVRMGRSTLCQTRLKKKKSPIRHGLPPIPYPRP